jgi:proline-rich protein PRCC
MMLGIEDYGSGDDSDGEEGKVPKSSPKAPQAISKSSLSLPPPKSAPQPKRVPKRIAINVPAPKSGDDEEEEESPAKKPRLDVRSCGNKSSLTSLLPAPKQKAVPPATQKVLGGGGGPRLVFSSSQQPRAVPSPEPPDPEPTASPSSALFQPLSVGKRKPNISLEENAAPRKVPLPKTSVNAGADFFSLGVDSSSSSMPSSSRPANPVTDSTPTLTGLSSAPQIDEFVPPEPTPTDPYPGYYLLPSGSWAAHDPAYYNKFYAKWQAEYNAHVRALEKGKIKGFEDLDDDATTEVNALKEMERAKKEIQEREERKSITHGADGAPAAPRMNIQVCKPASPR